MDKTFKIIGAHGNNERQEDDFYATDPHAIDELLKAESFSHDVWECACGMNHLSYRLMDYGFNVRMSDIKKRIDDDRIEIIDFLKVKNYTWDGDIITNPPYKYAVEFIQQALNVVKRDCKVAMLLRIQFLEGKQRYEKIFIDNPPCRIYVFTKRLYCAINGEFYEHSSSAICYAWFVWVKGFKGKPTIEWINVY